MIHFVAADESDLGDLVADLEAAGPCDVVIGGGTKDRALARFAETLSFPDWFGGNLDALYELLDERADAATAAGRDWTLLWVPSLSLVVEHPRDYAGVVAVLADVARASSRRLPPAGAAHGGRHVVVRGPDPSHRPEPSHRPDPPRRPA